MSLNVRLVCVRMAVPEEVNASHSKGDDSCQEQDVLRRTLPNELMRPYLAPPPEPPITHRDLIEGLRIGPDISGDVGNEGQRNDPEDDGKGQTPNHNSQA